MRVTLYDICLRKKGGGELYGKVAGGSKRRRERREPGVKKGDLAMERPSPPRFDEDSAWLTRSPGPEEITAVMIGMVGRGAGEKGGGHSALPTAHVHFFLSFPELLMVHIHLCIDRPISRPSLYHTIPYQPYTRRRRRRRQRCILRTPPYTGEKRRRNKRKNS